MHTVRVGCAIIDLLGLFEEESLRHKAVEQIDRYGLQLFKSGWRVAQFKMLRLALVPSERDTRFDVYTDLFKNDRLINFAAGNVWESDQKHYPIPAEHHYMWGFVQSIAYKLLQDYHDAATRPEHLSHCRNITHWFDSSTWQPTELGRECQELVAAVPLEDLLSASGGEDSRVLQLDWPEVTLPEVSYSMEWYFWSQDILVMLQKTLVAGWPLWVFFLCWRPDVLVFWRRTGLDVRTPSFSAYSKQVKQQQALAKKARQAAATATGTSSQGRSVGGIGTTTTSSSYRSSSSRLAPALRSRGYPSSTSARRMGAALAPGGGSSGVAGIAPGDAELQPPAAVGGSSISLFVSWVSYVFKQCWWARVCFAVSCYWQLPWRRFVAVGVIVCAVTLARS